MSLNASFAKHAAKLSQLRSLFSLENSHRQRGVAKSFIVLFSTTHDQPKPRRRCVDAPEVSICPDHRR